MYTTEQLLSDDTLESAYTEPESEASTEQVEETQSESEAEEPIVSTGEEEGLPPEPENTVSDEDRGKNQALLAERKKRQALEKRVQELESTPENKPDFYDDPDKYLAHVEGQISEMRLQSKIDISRQFMMKTHDDYEEKEQAFLKLAEDDPTLITQLQNSEMPADFAYNYVIKQERMQQFDNLDDAIETEINKRLPELEKAIEARLRGEIEQAQSKVDAIPPSGASKSKGSDTSASTDYTTDELFN